MRKLTWWTPWKVAPLILVAMLAFTSCGGPALHGGRVHANPHFGKPPAGDYRLSSRRVFAIPFIPGYDAVTLSAIPRHPPVVGCYADGRYANCTDAQRDFPLAYIVKIDVRASDVGGRCLDTEPGDSQPPQVAGWLRLEFQIGIQHPCDYSDTSEAGQVLADVSRAGISRFMWYRWLADWDGNPGIPSGFNAKQWRSTSSLDYDSFATYFFHAPPPPLPICFTHRISKAECAKAKKQVASWQRALASSERASTARSCPVLEQRITWFAGRLRAHPQFKTASRKRALAASRTAARRQNCSLFAARVGLFTSLISQERKRF